MKARMNTAKLDSELTQAVTALIDAGCHYRLDDLAECYAPDLQILMVQEDGTLHRFDYAQNMAFFKHLHDSGAPPLNTAVHFNAAEVQDGTGYVIATRHMDLGAGEKTIVFSLMLRQETGRWRVFREHALIQGD